jgi:hypothetical protein
MPTHLEALLQGKAGHLAGLQLRLSSRVVAPSSGPGGARQPAGGGLGGAGGGAPPCMNPPTQPHDSIQLECTGTRLQQW